MELLVLRLICLVGLFIATLLAGISPLVLFRKLQIGETVADQVSKNAKKIAFMICLGGGVLFSTSFLHLLPEVTEHFENYWNQTDNGTTQDVQYREFYPFLVICGGFLLVYALEMIVHAFTDQMHHQHGHVHNHHEGYESIENARNEGSPGINGETVPLLNSSNNETNSSSISINGLIIVAALSFHSVFEGLALGIQSDINSTLMLLLAISLHKLVIAFVVGLQILGEGGSKYFLILAMTIFSIMSPVGIGISILTEMSFDGSITNLISALLNGVAAGTLIYITFMEVLQKHNHKAISPYVQFFAFLIGFTINSLIQVFLST